MIWWWSLAGQVHYVDLCRVFPCLDYRNTSQTIRLMNWLRHLPTRVSNESRDQPRSANAVIQRKCVHFWDVSTRVLPRKGQKKDGKCPMGDLHPATPSRVFRPLITAW